MSENTRPAAYPRAVAEGTVPLIAVEGTARDCGRRYGQIVLEKYPGYRRYLDTAGQWSRLSGEARRLFERRAAFVPEIYEGLAEVAGPPSGSTEAPPAAECTSFGVSPGVTLDGHAISGQNKDPVSGSALLHIVLRMRIQDGPTILVLAYPGEVLGYGMWSTGASVFRNSLWSRASGEPGLEMGQWALLSLAGGSTAEAVELARRHGIAGDGNVLFSDAAGSVSVEFNAGGISVVQPDDGVVTHANHPVGSETAPFEYAYGDDYPTRDDGADSRIRMDRLAELLGAERGRLTPQRALMCMSDHANHPRGLCRHLAPSITTHCTTGSVIVEPTRGRLYAVRGNPCCNWPTTYTV